MPRKRSCTTLRSSPPRTRRRTRQLLAEDPLRLIVSLDRDELETWGAKAGNMLLVGPTSRFASQVHAKFPGARNLSRALFLGAIQIAKSFDLHSNIDPDMVVERLRDPPLALTALAIGLVESIADSGLADRLKEYRNHRRDMLDVIRSIDP